MIHKYHCVSCGQEIKEEDMLVPLSYMALDGASEKEQSDQSLFVTKKQLEEICRRIDKETGSQYITMEELLEIAYAPRNRHDLLKNSAASTSKEAYERYKETWDAAMQELNASRKLGDDPDDFNELDSRDEEQKRLDAYDKVEIPGFSRAQISQLCVNFPNGVCHSKMNMVKGYGLEFKLNLSDSKLSDSKKVKKNTRSYFCPHCQMEICDCAFEKKQIMIGFVGFQKVGKSCLIMALSNYLLEAGGILKIPNPGKEKLFTKQYRSYRAGLTLMKTESEQGTETQYSPSVLFEDVLWTFVDVPGDAIYDPTKAPTFDPAKINKDQKMQAILNCNSYILCTRSQDIEEPIMRTKTMDVFQKFLKFASEARDESNSMTGRETEILFPVILTLTQLDESAAVKGVSQADKVPFNMDQYRKKYKNEYSIMMANGMRHIIDSMQSLCYLTPISTSAYGFEPDNYKVWERDQKWDEDMQEWKEQYRKPEPRNLGEIFDWVRMINGYKPALVFEESDKKLDLSNICRAQSHFNDDIVTAIAQLFCNPSEIDKEWYNTIGGGLFTSMKRSSIQKKARKAGMKPQN